QVRLAEGLPRVLGDAVQLQQVVLNLLVNACQAMADVADGPRVLRIETAEPKPGSIEITVADTGAGVAGPELERMFEPFVSSKAEGLGMGLSINRSIVEAHGGLSNKMLACGAWHAVAPTHFHEDPKSILRIPTSSLSSSS